MAGGVTVRGDSRWGLLLRGLFKRSGKSILSGVFSDHGGGWVCGFHLAVPVDRAVSKHGAGPFDEHDKNVHRHVSQNVAGRGDSIGVAQCAVSHANAVHVSRLDLAVSRDIFTDVFHGEDIA